MHDSSFLSPSTSHRTPARTDPSRDDSALEVMVDAVERLIQAYARQAGLSLEEAREHVACAVTDEWR